MRQLDRIGPRLYHITSSSFQLTVSRSLQSTTRRLLDLRSGRWNDPLCHKPVALCANRLRLSCENFLRSQLCHVVRLHTGNSAFLWAPPALSSACCIYGPTTGMFATNPLIVEKKSPKSTIIPYISIRKPTRGHRSNMSMIPAANAAVPFNF